MARRPLANSEFSFLADPIAATDDITDITSRVGRDHDGFGVKSTSHFQGSAGEAVLFRFNLMSFRFIIH